MVNTQCLCVEKKKKLFIPNELRVIIAQSLSVKGDPDLHNGEVIRMIDDQVMRVRK